MEQQSNTGSHEHCFCKHDTGGNIMCCKCGAVLASCDKCPVEVCFARSALEKMVKPGAPLLWFNCPIVTTNYEIVYKRTLV